MKEVIKMFRLIKEMFEDDKLMGILLVALLLIGVALVVYIVLGACGVISMDMSGSSSHFIPVIIPFH